MGAFGESKSAEKAIEGKVQVHCGALDLSRLILMTIVFGARGAV